MNPWRDAPLQGTLDALTSRLAILDPNGVVVAVNEAWRSTRIPGALLDPGDDVGRNYLELCRAFPGTPAKGSLAEGIEEVLRGERPSLEYPYDLPGPPTRSYVARVSRFRDDSGMVVVVHEDVTRLREAEQRLRESQEALRHSDRLDALGRLSGGIAHDFNNLLTAIQGNAALLQAKLGGGDGSEELREIRRAAERASDLTRQLLAFGRKQLLRPSLVDPNEVIRDSARLLRRLIGSHIEISTLLEPAAGHVRVDPGQLEQVLVNLALNARDAMPGGGRLQIRSRRGGNPEGKAHPEGATPDPGWITLEVSDTGEGMDAALLDRIFEPFFTTRGSTGGTGLGLATVHGIVHQSGGRITVDSTPGVGSTFTVHLPLAAEGPGDVPDSEEGAQGAEPSDVGGLAGSAPLLRGTVLLVEDEASVRRLAAIGLKASGLEVVSAANGEEALRVVGDQLEGIDLLVTDVIMPLLGGRELAARLRARNPDLPILFISGYTGETLLAPGDWIRGDPGRVAFLAKPFTLEELSGAVRSLLAPGDRSAAGEP